MTVSPIFQRLLEVLADGEWHDLEDVIREVGKIVPPAKALRVAERKRLSGGVQSQERLIPADVVRLIESGKRNLVRESLTSYRFEIEPKGLPGRRAVKIPRRVRYLKDAVPGQRDPRRHR